MNIFDEMKTKITDKVVCAFNAAVESGELSGENVDITEKVKLEVPKDKSHGDFACNLAMMLAKPLRCAPRAIAEAIVSHLGEDEDIAKAEVAGAGFINFYLTPNWLYRVMEDIESRGTD